jgi:hypothetical protein
MVLPVIHSEDSGSQTPLVVFFDPDSLASDAFTARIESSGLRISSTRDPEAARIALDRESPAAVVIVEGTEGPRDDGGLQTIAKELGIPVFGVLSEGGISSASPDNAPAYDGWVQHTCADHELHAQIHLTLSERRTGADKTMPVPPIPVDERLLAMIIHDIRNPLNVIGLTLRVIEQMPPGIRNELQEDLGYLRDNAVQIEKMLSLLSDLCRLNDPSGPSESIPLDPARFVEDIVEERGLRGQEKAFPARFEKDNSTPASVVLDPTRARLALLSVFNNAAAAADRPLSVRTSGQNDRWTITVQTNNPPPATVTSRSIDHTQFERLLPTPAERRGLDLAIASWISAQFGGSVRLEATPEVGSSIVMEWPITCA